MVQKHSTPPEEQRLQMARVFLERTIRNRNKHVQGCLAELVFSLNEVSISDWADRKTRKVAIQMTIDGQTRPHAVSRNVKYISLIPLVSTARESLPLDVITSDNFLPVQEQLRKDDVHFRQDLILKYKHRSYVNAEIIFGHIRTVFSLYLVGTRGLVEFLAENAC
jgi:hypothetical protein